MFHLLSSKINGKGVYASKNIKEGELIYFRPVQEMVLKTRKEIENLSPAAKQHFIRYSYQIGDDLWALSEDNSDYWNHSCSPNCYFGDESTIRALKDIQEGEELTIDYAFTDTVELEPPYFCSCLSKECRKIIAADDWKREDLRKKYAGKFLPYIEKKIKLSYS